jgi:hypothetical protein
MIVNTVSWARLVRAKAVSVSRSAAHFEFVTLPIADRLSDEEHKLGWRLAPICDPGSPCG